MKINKSKLELAMARACVTLREVADAANTSSTTIYNIINEKKGKANNPSVVGKIAKALGIDPAEIIEKDDE